MQQKDGNCSMKEKMAKGYIMEALLGLMNKKDYNDITITDITKKAGVNRVTFYRNFTNKDDVIIEHLKNCDKQFEKNRNENDKGLYQMLRYFNDNKKLISLIYKSKSQHLLLKHLLSNLNYNKNDENIWAYTKSAWAYFMFGWAQEWYLRGMKESPEELIEIIEKVQNQKQE